MIEKKQRKNDRKYEGKYGRDKDFCFEFFLSLNISDFSLFFMKNLQSPLKKPLPSFSENPYQNCNLVKPPCLKIW